MPTSSSTPATALASYLAEIRTALLDRLNHLDLPTEPTALYTPLRYGLAAPGKCLRPALTITVGEALGARRENLLDPALAIEVLHTFTLVHDDIMDQASQRRGRPTIHIQWDTNTALLVGDAMLTLSFELLLQKATARHARLGYLLAQTMRQICAGQALDIEFEKREIVSPAEYLQMIGWKTGALLGAACQCGALIAGAPVTIADRFRIFGLKLGQAFQVQDDLLELTAEVEQMGKSLISDISTGKKTYPIILVLQQLPPAERQPWLQNLQSMAADRPAIRQAFERYGALQRTAELAARLFAEAEQQLPILPAGHHQPLQLLLQLIKQRQS